MDNERLVRNAVKAAVKGAAGVLILIAISEFSSPFKEMLPYQGLAFGVLPVVFVLLMVTGELLSGTVFYHVLNLANTLLLTGYMLYVFSISVLVFNIENITFIIDLRIILSIALVLNLVGFAKALLGLVGYLAENVKMEGKTLKA